jgi:Methyltransferase domain
MSREATKTRAVRGSDFAQKYLQGRVIDIGCGGDLVVPHAEPFDLQHGNAQYIGALRERGAYDAVCSSHCLEHMKDVPAALAQWWSLVREGGYLVLVVPDEDLYEQGAWPSLFNKDHKATFRLRKETSWSSVSFDIEKLVGALPGARIVSCERQDQGYDHSLRKSSISGAARLLFRIAAYWSAACRVLRLSGGGCERVVLRLLRAMGAPADQTEGPALAQIQIIARRAGGAAPEAQSRS